MNSPATQVAYLKQVRTDLAHPISTNRSKKLKEFPQEIWLHQKSILEDKSTKEKNNMAARTRNKNGARFYLSNKNTSS